MRNLINLKGLKINLVHISFAISFILLLIFGTHILLNLGRYLGTIARYAIEGNICLP